jgi:hypothetical protein
MLITHLKKLFSFLNAESNDTPVHDASLNTEESVDTALRFELETVENGWEWASLNHEIKIGLAGQVYFKIDRRWVLQSTITAISFVRE